MFGAHGYLLARDNDDVNDAVISIHNTRRVYGEHACRSFQWDMGRNMGTVALRLCVSVCVALVIYTRQFVLSVWCGASIFVYIYI